MKTFEFRLYPNSLQLKEMTTTIDVCRNIYNEMLSDRKNAYDRCGVGLSYYQQVEGAKTLNTGIHSQIVQDVLRRLDKAFQNFFRRVKNGDKKAGYPRFQGRNRYDSFTYPQSGFKILEDGKLKLSKIGIVRMFMHRKIEGKVKICTIKRDGNQWYACFGVELPEPTQKRIKTSIGVDVGITTLATLSDNTTIENPKTLNNYDSKLKKAHRNLSRKIKGSSNRNKQKTILAGIYRKVRNTRKDYLHKASHFLVDNYDKIVFEDLRIKNMVKNHHLARSIHDASWGMLINFTTYKAEEAGGVVEMVNPRNTSKTCSICGNVKSMPLSQRTYKCPTCGNIMDRDHNASINILNRRVLTDGEDFKPVEMVA